MLSKVWKLAGPVILNPNTYIVILLAGNFYVMGKLYDAALITRERVVMDWDRVRTDYLKSMNYWATQGCLKGTDWVDQPHEDGHGFNLNSPPSFCTNWLQDENTQKNISIELNNMGIVKTNSERFGK